MGVVVLPPVPEEGNEFDGNADHHHPAEGGSDEAKAARTESERGEDEQPGASNHCDDDDDDDERRPTIAAGHSPGLSHVSSVIPPPAASSSMNDDNGDQRVPMMFLRGVVAAKTIRSSYASLHLAVLLPTSSTASASEGSASVSLQESYDQYEGEVPVMSGLHDDDDDDIGSNDDDHEHDNDATSSYVIVRLQFVGQRRDPLELKSLCRRAYKHRDLIRVHVANAERLECGYSNDDDNVGIGSSHKCVPTHTYVIHLTSVAEAQQIIRVEEVNYWDIHCFQNWQRQHLPWIQKSSMMPQASSVRRRLSDNPALPPRGSHPCRGCDLHQPQQHACGHTAASGLDRARQAQFVANVLFHMVLHQLSRESDARRGQQEADHGGCNDTAATDSVNTDDPPVANDGRGGGVGPVGESTGVGVTELLRNLVPQEHWATTSPHDLYRKIRPQQSTQKPHESDDGPSVDDKLLCVLRHLFRRTYGVLNSGTGVVDVAGGSGYLSFALGSSGIQSTVVDPRARVGQLPKRHRKAWKKLMMNSSTIEEGGFNFPAPVPFQSLRAWFGGPPPSGVDDAEEDDSRCGDFVEPASKVEDEDDHVSSSRVTIPVVDCHHELVQHCTAIVALHPDQATDAVVDMAVRLHKPFCVVPCCVFSRLFPHRQLADGRWVRTHVELLDYLCEKHSSIQRSKLPFVGSNTILWSTFGE